MSNPTLDRLKAWLADDGNKSHFREYTENAMRNVITNGMRYSCVRHPFVTSNGYSVSIQQSGTHYCDNENEVEIWHCLPSPLLAPYGDGDDPYAHVPLEVAAGYIDSLETLPPKEQS